MAVLCKVLKSRGYDVKIVDFNFEVLSTIKNKKEVIDDKAAQKIVEKFWKNSLKSTISKFQPDLVGLTCMFTMGHEQLIRTSNFIRKQYKHMPIIVGGVHITNAPEFVLRETNSIDFASLYESDVSFCDIVDVINKKADKDKLNQVASIVKDSYIAIEERSPPDSEELNIIPDYDELPVGEYSLLGEVGSYIPWLPSKPKAASVLTNRGCRARCSFCSVRNFNGKSVRSRDVSSVVAEISKLKKDYEISHIVWIDDDLFFRQSRAINLFNEMAKIILKFSQEAF